MKSKILIICLGLSVSSFSLAEKHRFPIGQSGVSAEVDKSAFKEMLKKPMSIEAMNDRYQADINMKADIRGSMGQKSASTVPARVNASVPKTTVMSNLFKNAKAGGRLAVRGLGWLGLAYTLVDVYLKAEGWVYDDKAGNWVKKGESDVYILAITSTPFLNGNPMTKAQFDDWCSKNSCQFLKTVKGLNAAGNERWDYCGSLSTSEIRGRRTDSNYQCIAYTPQYPYGVQTQKYFNIISYLGGQLMTQDDFNQIIMPKADAAPSEYVDKSRPAENAPVPGMKVHVNVTVPNGTIAQTNPYTNPQTGQPEQTRWEFKTENNTTTVKEIRTPRPDLKPNSPEAPKSEKQPDTEPKTDDAQNPENTPSEKPKTETPPQSGLCDLFPNILACDKLPESEEPDLQIPEETVELNFKPDTAFDEYGQCPAPVSFQALGGTYSFSLEPACSLAEMMRPFIIAMAWLVAAFFIVKVVRESV